MRIQAFAVVAALATAGCGSERVDRLLHETDHRALLAACRRAMETLPPPGPPIDPSVYSLDPDPADLRVRGMRDTLHARTVDFDAPRDKPSVTDPQLPVEILRLEPLFVTVTPDAVHIALCGAGNSCSANATRSGLGLEALVFLEGAQPECRSLVEGLWYCHE